MIIFKHTLTIDEHVDVHVRTLHSRCPRTLKKTPDTVQLALITESEHMLAQTMTACLKPKKTAWYAASLCAHTNTKHLCMHASDACVLAHANIFAQDERNHTHTQLHAQALFPSNPH
jgi:hypothetical protein